MSKVVNTYIALMADTSAGTAKRQQHHARLIAGSHPSMERPRKKPPLIRSFIKIQAMYRDNTVFFDAQAVTAFTFDMAIDWQHGFTDFAGSIQV